MPMANTLLNPSMDEVRAGELDLVVAGTHNAVMMVESEAKELSEDVMLGAVMFAHRECKKVIEAIIKLAEKSRQASLGHGEQRISPPPRPKLKSLSGQGHRRRLQADRQISPPRTRSAMPAPRQDGICRRHAAGPDGRETVVKKLEAEIVRTAILKDGKRNRRAPPPARSARSRRSSASCRAPTVSALFKRGETPAICTTTLARKSPSR